MDYRLAGTIFSLLFPKEYRREFRQFCRNVHFEKQLAPIIKNYAKVQADLKSKDKINVLFLVNEISKWKNQTLYDLLEKSDKFEPIIALTIADIQVKLSNAKKKEELEHCYNFFKSKGMNVVYAYDFKTNRPTSLKQFNPQFVFYQQPYHIAYVQRPQAVSKYALTFYVPYYIVNCGDIALECKKELHKSVFRYYVLNKDWEELFTENAGKCAGKISGLGHPMLDYFYLHKDFVNTKDYVIYAPHWSIDHKKNVNFENCSTFDKNGREILEYAKAHPEINWVFKPHPTLKPTIIKTGIMTEEEVENYYKEWEKIGLACYTPDYMELFLNSKAMITDSGSFLTEYFCTGKPLIHLISSTLKIKPFLSSQKMLDTYYKARNLDDMYKHFDDVLLHNNDYLKDERLQVLAQSGLSDNYAAQNIMEDFEKIIANNG